MDPHHTFDETPGDEAPTYAQNARPVGFPVTYTIKGNRLIVDQTRKISEVQLSAVEQVRLTYEPRSFARRAYRTTIRVTNGKTVSYTSISWKSMIEARAQDEEYRGFTRDLMAAVAKANPRARFIAGKPFPIWVLLTVLAFTTLVVLALFTWRAFSNGATSAALFGLAIAALGLWQLEPMVRLNKPQDFTPENPPRELLP